MGAVDQDPESAACDRGGSAGDDRPADTHTRDGDARAAQAAQSAQGPEGDDDDGDGGGPVPEPVRREPVA